MLAGRIGDGLAPASIPRADLVARRSSWLRLPDQDMASIHRHPVGVRVLRLRRVSIRAAFDGAGLLYRPAIRRIHVEPAVEKGHLSLPFENHKWWSRGCRGEMRGPLSGLLFYLLDSC